METSPLGLGDPGSLTLANVWAVSVCSYLLQEVSVAVPTFSAVLERGECGLDRGTERIRQRPKNSIRRALSEYSLP